LCGLTMWLSRKRKRAKPAGARRLQPRVRPHPCSCAATFAEPRVYLWTSAMYSLVRQSTRQEKDEAIVSLPPKAPDTLFEELVLLARLWPLGRVTPQAVPRRTVK
jgi:hypothetical protein